MTKQSLIRPTALSDYQCLSANRFGKQKNLIGGTQPRMGRALAEATTNQEPDCLSFTFGIALPPQTSLLTFALITRYICCHGSDGSCKPPRISKSAWIAVLASPASAHCRPSAPNAIRGQPTPFCGKVTGVSLVGCDDCCPSNTCDRSTAALASSATIWSPVMCKLWD